MFSSFKVEQAKNCNQFDFILFALLCNFFGLYMCVLVISENETFRILISTSLMEMKRYRMRREGKWMITMIVILPTRQAEMEEENFEKSIDTRTHDIPLSYPVGKT